MNRKRAILISLVLVLAGVASVSTFGIGNDFDPMSPNYMGFDVDSDVTIGDTVYCDIWVDVYSAIDTASVDNLTYTPGIMDYEPNTVFGDLLGGMVVQMKPESNGVIDNVNGYCNPITWGHSSSVNNTNGTLATCEWTAVGYGTTTFAITAGGTSLGGIDPGTTKYTKDVNVHPMSPNAFDATLAGATQIDLDWNAQTHPYTVVRGKVGSYPADPTDGYEVYNNTGTTASDSGLTPGLVYYYRAWGYHPGSGFFSLTYDEDYQATNQAPVIASPDPVDTAIDRPITQATVQCGISDPDPDSLSWTIEVSTGDSDSGSTSGGTIFCALTTPLDYATTYTWWVNVTDSYVFTREVYTFTTTANQNPNAPTNEDPTDASYIHPYNLTDLSCTVTDPESQAMDVEFYITGIGLVGTDTAVASGGTATVDISSLSFDFNDTYEWHVEIEDTEGGATVGPDWEVNTITETMGGEVDPEVYHYGTMDFDEEKQASLEVTNTGNSIIDVEFRVVNGVMLNGDYQWNLSTTPGEDEFTLQLYNPTIGYVNVTDSYTELYSDLEPAETVEFKVILHTPTESTSPNDYDDAMEGRLDVRFSDGVDEDIGEFEFDCTPPEDSGLRLVDSEDVVFLRGSILSADTFYMSIPSAMTEDTEIELPQTYEKKHWVFWRQTTNVNSIKVVGIKNDWQFQAVDYDGDIDDKITLDINDIDDWAGFFIIPNPGYFQTSDWWFDILNDARGRFVDGESLV